MRVLALLVVLLVLTTTGARGQDNGVLVSATAYTCAPHPANAMANTPGMCVVTRWGSDPHAPGMACPASWRGRVFEVEGVRLTCDDTGAYDYYNGLPHIDVRLATYPAAYAWGVRTNTIWEVTRDGRE